MKILKLNSENPDKNLINEAIDVMAKGGVILYPTDTVYGLGANIFNKDAVEKIYNIKNRDSSKPLSILVPNIGAISLVADLNLKNAAIVQKWLPGPFTFVLPKTNIVPSYVSRNSNVGVRIPDSKIATSLSALFPIITTSANLSDKETFSNPKDILKQIGHSVDLVINVGDLKSLDASTIIDLTSFRPSLVRKGAQNINFTKDLQSKYDLKEQRKNHVKHNFKN